MFVFPAYKIRPDVLLMRKFTTCFHSMFACHEHWNGEHGVNMSFCTKVDWVMHGSITKWPLTRSRSKHVCSKCALHKNECSIGPDHCTLVSFTLVVQIRLYFGSDGNWCTLTSSLVVLLQPAATHLDGIIENNKLQTWQKTLENFFSSNTLYAVWCAACIQCILGHMLCGLRIGNFPSVRHKCYVNEGVWVCRNAPPKF